MNALLHWFAAPEWSQLVKTLLHSLWQGVLIAVVLAVAMRRVANPHWRYRLALLALVMIPASGILTWAALNSPDRSLPVPVVQPAPVEPTPVAALGENPQTKLVIFANRSPAPPPGSWTAWLALLWIVGTSAMLGRASVKLAGAERLRRSCQPLDNSQVTQLLVEARRAVGLARRVRVAVTDKLTSPAVVGVLVPTLILPLTLVTTLTPEQIRFILLHELAHIRRGDYFANLFQFFIEAVLFFNPAVWWISNQVRREREACCDALAIELSGAPTDYARTLVHVAESALNPPPVAAPAFGNERESSSLADRVQRLLVPGYRPSLRLTWRAMVTAFAMGALLLTLCAEGTRVAVAQITKPLSKAPSSTEALSQKLAPELADESAETSGDFLSPALNSQTWKGSDWFAESESQLRRDNLGGMTNWPVEITSVIPLPALRLDQPTSTAGKPPFLGDLPWVGKLFTSSQMESVKTDFVQLSQLSTLSEEIRGEHNISDSLSVHFQDTVAGSDLILAQLLGNGAKLPANESNKPPSQVETAERLSIGDSITVKFAGTVDYIPPHEERIKKDGTITLPLIGTVTVVGKTAVELQKEIHDGYVPAYYKRLTVAVIGEEAVSFAGGRVPVRQVYHGDTSQTKASQSSGSFDRNLAPRSTAIPLIEIKALNESGRLEYDVSSGEVTVTNGAIVRFQDQVLRADKVQYDQRNGNLIASDNVRVERPGETNESTRIELNVSSNQPPAHLPEGRLIYTSPSRQAILAKLKGIRLDRVYFNAKPLMSVIGELQWQSFRRDSEGLGVTIGFKDFKPPTWNPDDMAEINVTISPPLTDVTLMDALDAVVKGASQPLRLIIEESTVSIALKKGDEPTPLFMREFKLDTAIFFSHLAEHGYRFDDSASRTNFTQAASSIRSFIASMGVDLQPSEGKSVFYSDRRGILLVRATKEELDVIGAVVQTLMTPDPQINVKVRFIEMPTEQFDALLGDLIGTNLPNTGGWTGILNQSQVDELLKRRKAQPDIKLLSEGEVTTLSGRQAQLQTVEHKTIVTGINPLALTPPGVTSTNDDVSGAYQMQLLSFGPTLDVMATATADQNTIQLAATCMLTEFQGYESIIRPSSTASVQVYINSHEREIKLPLPLLRTRQMTHNTIVRDGQTVVLGNPTSKTIMVNVDGQPTVTETSGTGTNILVVLVTPTIVDPAGNPILQSHHGQRQRVLPDAYQPASDH